MRGVLETRRGNAYKMMLMKAFIIVVLLLGMSYYLYKQQQTIADLQASLNTETAKSADLQKQLDTLKNQPASGATPAYSNPLANRGAAATPTPSGTSKPGNWMWDSHLMEAPSPSKGSHH